MNKTEAIILIGCLRQAIEKIEEAAIRLEKIGDDTLQKTIKTALADAISTLVVDAICPIESLYPELDPYKKN